ncbi:MULTISPECIES: hypothetical protein [Microbacterium]|uniref:hypothetical protein n=1 Tax=Microbacterium TaxID=33882 RepID=UPI00146A1CF6|nr:MULTISPECIES: hypothetical protein [Microbacterium]
MDAPPLTPERSRELADLRRRAYGPNADIGFDRIAQERLRELEELARSTPAAPPAVGEIADPGDEAREPNAQAGEPDAEASVPADATASETAIGPGRTAAGSTPDGPPPVATTRRWWRRIPVWLLAGVAGLAIGVAVALLWPTGASEIPPDRTLGVDPGGGERGAGFTENLDYWGVDRGTVVPHESLGAIQVWTAMGVDESRCLLLSHDGAFLSATCTGGGLDPVLDFTVYEDMVLELDDPLPTGTVIRFVGHEGSVDVWVREPGGQER